MYAQELQSLALPLMVPTPNGRGAVGVNREKWLLNPGSASSTHLEMFAFLGKLMGIAIRRSVVHVIILSPVQLLSITHYTAHGHPVHP